MQTINFSQRIIEYYRGLSQEHFETPAGIRVMNPYAGENADLVISSVEKFYNKYYSDNTPRTIILGINPGRHGAGHQSCELPGPCSKGIEPAAYS